jgi:hypothetical protein
MSRITTAVPGALFMTQSQLEIRPSISPRVNADDSCISQSDNNLLCGKISLQQPPQKFQSRKQPVFRTQYP